ncbi:hypothetical protein QT196_13085 [Streptomyces sp. P9-2B-2]|uniref:hypothetical protein n=1 Tax=unclassified Streptomyces TaxID=2593676 RepID=UPI002001DA2D|nr:MULTISPECIES: hypothetical protein [unclassified Streptomyces]WJY38149.1 hypothetical protein QT196_13085 [Streptomyces sp. P9-2B-2]
MMQSDSSGPSDSPQGRSAAPTTVDEALTRARAHFRPRCHDGSLASLHVQEFDIGYLVYATFPPTEPRSFGGSHLVISKTDGALTFVPNFPPDTAIARYRARRRPSS